MKSKVHDLKLGIMIARYSKGDELTLLEEGVFRFVSRMGGSLGTRIL